MIPLRPPRILRTVGFWPHLQFLPCLLASAASSAEQVLPLPTEISHAVFCCTVKPTSVLIDLMQVTGLAMSSPFFFLSLEIFYECIQKHSEVCRVNSRVFLSTLCDSGLRVTRMKALHLIKNSAQCFLWSPQNNSYLKLPPLLTSWGQHQLTVTLPRGHPHPGTAGPGGS